MLDCLLRRDAFIDMTFCCYVLLDVYVNIGMLLSECVGVLQRPKNFPVITVSLPLVGIIVSYV